MMMCQFSCKDFVPISQIESLIMLQKAFLPDAIVDAGS